MNYHSPAMDVLNNKNKYSKNSIRSLFISLLVVVAVTACGSGGGGGSSAVNTPPPATAVISGNAVAGPIVNGTVTAYAVTSSGSKGASLGITTTDASGAYSLTLSYTGAVFLEVTGGSYVDEATGQTVNVPTTPGTGLQAAVSNVTVGVSILAQITPLTTMAVARAQAMTGGLTPDNINAANLQVGYRFGSIYILSTQPINPLVANSATGAAQDAINYGLILAGLSKEAQTLGLTNPLDLVAALAQDFSDGVFNGEAGSTAIQLNGSAMNPATGTTGLGAAISTFSADTSHNLSGGTASSTLIAAISTSWVLVPNVTGLTQSAARTAITGVGLTVGFSTQASSTTVAYGNIISQSPSAGVPVVSGTAINLTISSATETMLYSFSGGTDGANPRGVIQGTDGNFYGTTSAGGANGGGVVFKMTQAGVETVLHSFGSGTDGSVPTGLIQGMDGNFYGTTWAGGANSAGTVFKITPAGVETVLYSFGASSTDGVSPNSLIQGTDGIFYGTTFYGGTNTFNTVATGGTVFKITPTGVVTILHSFGSGVDGAYPVGLIQGADGNFYGITSAGGANSLYGGTVFKMTTSGVETVLYSFGASSTDGVNPNSLTQGSDGNFYGTTRDGGIFIPGGGSFYGYCGTVFKITPAGTETVLYYFTAGTDGVSPNNLTQGADGNFYGAASFPDNVFKITPAGVETVLYSFVGGTDGYDPSSLIQSTDGNFYGTTWGGGANGGGTVFKLSP